MWVRVDLQSSYQIGSSLVFQMDENGYLCCPSMAPDEIDKSFKRQSRSGRSARKSTTEKTLVHPEVIKSYKKQVVKLLFLVIKSQRVDRFLLLQKLLGSKSVISRSAAKITIYQQRKIH
ncbi:hypothetical protein YC2023_041739 [Brassica napus]